jgi:hypothetical protein
MNPITEEDIANFLVHTPDFFERHAEVLATVQLTSPHGHRAVGLQERQAEMLREKIRVLERRMMDMIRHGSENMVISDKLQRWARGLFLVADAAALPAVLAADIRTQFQVPQVAIKVWDVSAAVADQPFALGASEDVRSLASSLTAPYCGVNAGFEAVGWLDDPQSVASLALLPLRESAAAPAFGMLVLASPDSQRFHAGMGTDFLERLADLASAALSRLRR